MSDQAEGGASPRDIVVGESPNRIRDHLSRTARYNPTKSLKRITDQLTQEYEDRFLVELLQNAYDAHIAGTYDGQVQIVLDESDLGSPVLYVANTGRPFDLSNFDALTNVAQSSKPPGEGIGNKGIGFRSVLQVCSKPEIFSVETDSSLRFDGFCFGFATPSDVKEMVSSDEEYETILRDFSLQLLPVPLEPTDTALDGFRRAGMVTVIRLPLDSPAALDVTRSQIQALLEREVLVALFLDRLAKIEISWITPQGHRHRTIERKPDRFDGGEDLTLSWLSLGGERFLLASLLLSAEELQGVIAGGVAAGELDAYWAEWDSDVEVSLAVALGDPPDWPMAYTYLPMQVRSPLFAHLHAPFHTKMARLNLNEKSHFNAHLLSTAARLAASAALHLRNADLVPLEVRQRLIADLLTWDDDHAHLLEDAFEAMDLDLETVELVPAHDAGAGHWTTLDQVRYWDASGLRVFTLDRIAPLAALLSPSLGDERTRRFVDTAESIYGHDLSPPDAQVAAWTEAVALTLTKATIPTWNRFYEDVEQLFQGRKRVALQGRRFILDSERRVRRAGPWDPTGDTAEPTIFFPPLTTRQEDEPSDEDELQKVPKGLQRAIAFVNDGIKLRGRERGQLVRTPVFDLLASGGLIERFDLGAVLGHLGRMLRTKQPIATYKQALSWVFAQEQASRAEVSDLHRVGLRVPTAAGWVPAKDAFFSTAWRTARASDLQRLLDAAGDSSPSLASIRERLIQTPSEWPFKVRDLEALRDFLVRAGVKDGLHPVALNARSTPELNGAYFTPSAIARKYHLQHPEAWVKLADRSWAGAQFLQGPYTPYTGDDVLWTLPGTEDVTALSDVARLRLAVCMVDSMAEWPTETWTYGFRRRSPQHRGKEFPQQWPSPLAAFVEAGEWFPMADPGRRDEHYFVSMSRAWTYDETASEPAPRFARLAPRDIRRRLAGPTRTQEVLNQRGLKIWNDVRSAPARLTELAALVQDGVVTESNSLSIQRAAIDAWAELVADPQLSFASGTQVLVKRGGTLTTADPDDVEVYVHDCRPGLASHVLEAKSASILVSDERNGIEVSAALERAGYHTRRTSQVRAEVLLDGVSVEPSPQTGAPLLEKFDPWLVRTLITVLDVRSRTIMRMSDQALRDAEARVRQLHLVRGEVIELDLNGDVTRPRGRLADSVHLDDGQAPLIVLRTGAAPVPSWRALEVLAEDVAELVGRPQMGAELRVAALSLDHIVAEWREPSPEELARALREPIEAITTVLRSLRSSADHARDLLLPIVAVEMGLDVAVELDGIDLEDHDALLVALSEIVGNDRAADLVQRAEEADSLDELRRDLGTPFAALNAALLALGRTPITFPAAHDVALGAYLAAHRDSIFDRLRARFVGRFRALGDLLPYVELRSLASLHPDPTWLAVHEEPSEELLAARVAEWLETSGDTPENGSLQPVDHVRETNTVMLDQLLPRLQRVVAAWTRKQGRPTEVWQELPAIRGALNAAGSLDFEVLDEETTIRWLVKVGVWPASMPLTSSPDDLGLTVADFDAAAGEAARTREASRRRRTELRFGDRAFDTSSDELRDLIAAVVDSVDEGFLSASKTVAKLGQITPAVRAPSRGSRTGKGQTYTGAWRPSPEQLGGIGVVGEALAFRWLREAYAEVTPESWVSGNRTHELLGGTGDDSLGYDFEVRRRSGTLYFEVKATTTDDFAFDFGESELRAARAARKGAYRILFIRSVLTPDDRELLILPNPLEESSRDLFTQVNQGVRLQFAPL